MNKKDIFGLFIIMGMIVCASGVVIADILAYIIIFFQVKYEFIEIPIPGFPFTALPMDLSITKIFAYSFLTLLICLIGTLYPAYKTMKIDIIEVLHEEQQN
jgi:ABC-type lipoprotein release transport system permease subunit